MQTEKTYTIALAGNPNVGKSTIFNGLTGMHQHTGNWPGKTVELAGGVYHWQGTAYRLTDLPGTYSLFANSPEEEIARDYLCSGDADVTLVVADATCLRRNLNLVLQVREAAGPMVLCVNLLDEAKKKRLEIDLEKLSALLGVPVVGTAARSGEGLPVLKDALGAAAVQPRAKKGKILTYDLPVERALSRLEPSVAIAVPHGQDSRWCALQLLQQNGSCQALLENQKVAEALPRAVEVLSDAGLTGEALRDSLVSAVTRRACEIADACVAGDEKAAHGRDRRLDRLFLSRRTGIPAMLLLLASIFWLTIYGANKPSQLLSDLLFSWQEPLRCFLRGLPVWLSGALVDGVYRTVAWVVSVMLPPMAIFFPLFTLLEDAGYLPRVAFNMDHFFRAAGAHGRQSLTMCMGFGCNACGVTGCRIIDSPRERLVAMLTNSFVPCNGRFPTLIVLITLFFAGGAGLGNSLTATGLFVCAILFSVCMTLLASKFLTKTLLRGETSSFSLELPPYRRPQLGKVIVRSILDRTLFVLGRAVTVAAPAGLFIWIMGNVTVGGASLLHLAAEWLDPLGHLMGVDGMIVLAFLLGFPANEIVMPILLMGYLATGTLTSYDSLSQLQGLLTANGWTGITALCTMLLCLLHFPCGTTCLTLYRETGSLKWTMVGILLPTVMGFILCVAVHGAAVLLGLT